MSKFKIILKSYRSQKMKFFLIFLITFVTLLIFNVSSSIKESVVETRLKQLRDNTENSQIVISAKEGSYEPFDEEILNEKFSKETKDSIETQIVRDYLIIQDENTNEDLFLYGTDVDQQRKIFDFSLESGDIENWTDSDIMISTEYARKHSLKVGDKIDLCLGEKKESMQIKAISQNKGMFLNAYDFAITSLGFIDKICEQEGLINRVDITLIDLKNMDQITERMNEELKGTGLAAVAKYNMSYYNGYVTTVVLALNIFSIFLLLLMVYMMFSLFQSYVYENVGQMATLRSLGFSIGEYRQILCMQVAFLVLVTFLLSFICTPVTIKLMGGMLFQQNTNVKMNISLVLLKGLAVLVIAIISIYTASYKVSKAPVISLIQNNVSYINNSFHKKRFALGILSLGALLGCIIYNKQQYSLIIYYVQMILLLVTLILFQDLFIRVYGLLIEKIFHKRRGFLGLFGKQVKSSLTSYLPAITTLVFVLAIAMSVLAMSQMLDKAMGKMYSGADLHITVKSNELDSFKKVLDDNKEVSLYATELRKNLTIKNSKIMIAGVGENLSDESYQMITDSGEYETFRKLSKEPNIILSDTLAKRWKMKKGDSLTIESKSFKILGIIKTFENMGEVIYLSEASFYDICDTYNTCVIFVQSKEKDSIQENRDNLQEKMDLIGDSTIITLKDMNQRNMQANQAILNALFIFAVIIILLSGIGLCSVVMINILLRQKEFVIYQTVGITKANILKISFCEAISMFVYGVLNAFLILPFLLRVMTEVLSFYVGNLGVSYSPSQDILLLLIMFVLIVGVILGVTKKYALSEGLIEKLKVN